MKTLTHQRFIDIKEIHSAFTVVRSENYNFSGEAHDFWEMVYVSKGSVGVAADSRILKCSTGTVIFHKPNEFHRIWNAGKDDIEFTIVSFVAYGDYLSQLYDKVIHLDLRGLSLMDEIKNLIAENGPDDNYMAENFCKDEWVLASFCTTLEHFLYMCAQSEDEVHPRTSGNAAIFTAAVNKMHQNLGGQIKIQQIADELHISLTQLKRIFKKYTLKGVHEYFLALKIEKAKAMLSDGNSVYDTALSIGFYNQNYFSAAFKREVGITPSEWARKNMRQ